MDELTVLKKREHVDIATLFVANKELIFPSLFYVSGLIIGAILYTVLEQGTFKELIEQIAQGCTTDFLTLFLNKTAIYLSVYTVCVLLGLCLIGFPFINIIPLLCGVEIALKLAYYYVNFDVKGVGYSLLIIAPGAVGFVTILVFTIKLCNTLSKTIYYLTTNKADTIQEVNLKSYLLRFLLYSLIVLAIAALSALITHLLSSIIVL